MKKLKIVTVVGTRPEIIRLSRVINILDLHCEHILIHTGQNYDYELNQIFFDDLDIRKPDHFLNIIDPNHSPSSNVGRLLIAVDKVLEDEAPDAFLVLGDTNSAVSVIAAKRKKIPTFHMEAGNRCFDQRVPEEINRKIIDHTSDINITYSSIAREYLLREGLNPDLIIKSGSPMYEVLDHNKEKIDKSKILQECNLVEKKFFLVSAHREENINNKEKIKSFEKLINFLSENYDLPIILSTHPRTMKMLKNYNIKFDNKVRILKPFSFTDYVKLQVSSFVVLSDSGTINEESSILNFPAINIREAHERPEAMEEGAVMMLGFNIKSIQNGISILKDQSRGQTRSLNIPKDYDVKNVSEKILRIIYSYTDYINRVIWKKY